MLHVSMADICDALDQCLAEGRLDSRVQVQARLFERGDVCPQFQLMYRGLALGGLHQRL